MSNVHQQNTKFVSSGGPLVLVQNMLRRQWQSDCPIGIFGVGFSYCPRSSVEQHFLDVINMSKFCTKHTLHDAILLVLPYCEVEGIDFATQELLTTRVNYTPDLSCCTVVLEQYSLLILKCLLCTHKCFIV